MDLPKLIGLSLPRYDQENPKIASLLAPAVAVSTAVSTPFSDKLINQAKLASALARIKLYDESPNIDQHLQKSVDSAYKEWNSGVCETHGKNRSPRIDQYARNASFGKGYEWCGFFVAFNYSQSGFKEPEQLASYQKARDFFLYRSYTDNSSKKNDELDSLQLQHQLSGDQRKYFMLEGSTNIKRVSKDLPDRYKNYDAKANTFSYENLPIMPGDTALFSRGHLGMVVEYDQATGKMTTIEGNSVGKNAKGKTVYGGVTMNEYDLSDPATRKKFDGFGRPSAFDFE